MPTNGSRTQPTRGSMTPAVALAADHRAGRSHQLHDVRLADGGAETRAPGRGRDVRAHARRGHVDRHRAGLLPEPVLHRQRERRLLADAGAGFVDEREPVGVRVEDEADGALVLLHPRRDIGEVRRDRFRLVGEQPGRLTPMTDHITTKIIEQRRTEWTAGAGVGIEEDAEPPPRDGRDADRVEHRAEVIGAGVRRDAHAAGAVPCGPREVARFVQVADGAAGVGGQHGAVGAEHLQPVPRGRVVARGDLDSTGRVHLPHREPARRRRDDADVLDGAAGAEQAREDRVPEHLAAGSAVAREYDPPAGEGGAVSGGEPCHRFGGEAGADDAANPRHRHDQIGRNRHDANPCGRRV